MRPHSFANAQVWLTVANDHKPNVPEKKGHRRPWAYIILQSQGALCGQGVRRGHWFDTTGYQKHEVVPWQPECSVCLFKVGKVWADFVPDTGRTPFVIRTCLGGQVGHSTIKRKPSLCTAW